MLFPVNVAEIVRVTSLAIRRRRELLGPLGKFDPLTNDLVNVLSRRPGPANHWSQAWVQVQLGCAYSAAGNAAQASTILQQALLVGGEYDHPLTSTALLELGRISARGRRFSGRRPLSRRSLLRQRDLSQPDQSGRGVPLRHPGAFAVESKVGLSALGAGHRLGQGPGPARAASVADAAGRREHGRAGRNGSGCQLHRHRPQHCRPQRPANQPHRRPDEPPDRAHRVPGGQRGRRRPGTGSGTHVPAFRLPVDVSNPPGRRALHGGQLQRSRRLGTVRFAAARSAARRLVLQPAGMLCRC